MKEVRQTQKCKKNANSTRGSQAVTHPSTNRARRCLTSVIGREPVYSTWYGRWRESGEIKSNLICFSAPVQNNSNVSNAIFYQVDLSFCLP